MLNIKKKTSRGTFYSIILHMLALTVLNIPAYIAVTIQWPEPMYDTNVPTFALIYMLLLGQIFAVAGGSAIYWLTTRID